MQKSPRENGGATTITDLHPDILRAHILPRLDGPALTAAHCTSSHLRSVSSDKAFWKSVTSSTWPSTTEPRVSQAISAFPSSYRSFFSDSYPLLHHNTPQASSLPSTTSLISAVDVYYEGSVILSRVQETETASSWFMSSPFRIDLIDHKESVRTPTVNTSGKNTDDWLSHVEENLMLSWIIIDPASHRAANISSRRPVSVSRHWLTGEVQARFSAVVAGIGRGTEKERVRLGVVVTCEGRERGQVRVREAGLQAEDMEGKSLSGRDSLVILAAAVTEGERRGGKGREIGKEGKRMEMDFEEWKREWRARKQRKEKASDSFCISVAVMVFVAFWSLIFFR